MAAVGTGAMLLPFAGQIGSATAPDPARGNLYGALAGLTWALTLAGLRWLGRSQTTTDDSAATVLVGNIFACLFSLPFAWPVTHAAPIDYGVILYLGVFQIGLAYVALTRSIRYVPALEAATLLLIEPVFNPIWTWLVHGERPTGLALFCGLLIIFGTFGGVWWFQRRNQPVTL